VNPMTPSPHKPRTSPTAPVPASVSAQTHSASLKMNFAGELPEATKQLQELRLCAEDLGFEVRLSAVGEKPVLSATRLVRSAA
jgi:hypothetical protein